MAHEYLRKVEHKLAIKYSLKRAIMSMGPRVIYSKDILQKSLSDMVTRQKSADNKGLLCGP